MAKISKSSSGSWAKQNSSFYYYVKKPTAGEKQKIN